MHIGFKFRLTFKYKKERYRNITEVQDQLRKQIHPILDGRRECTMMLLDNLAYPEWASINCNARLLIDIVCVKNKSVKQYEMKNMFAAKNFYCKRKYSFSFQKTCFSIFWFSGSFHSTRNCLVSDGIFVSLETTKHFNFLFLATNSHLPPLLSLDCFLKHVFKLTYTKYFDRVSFEINTIKVTDNTSGIFIQKTKTSDTDKFPGNVHRCSSEVYISGILIDNGIVNCLSDSSDESDYSNFCSTEGRCSPLCQKSHQSKGGHLCVHYSPSFNATPSLTLYYFTCSSGRRINISFLNDLVSDCGADAEDEYVYKLLLLHGHQSQCSQSAMIPCVSGHSICHSIDDICVFKLDQSNILVPCRNGGHMQECQNFTCNAKYKCPGSYCLPFRYVCNGKWDCPNGDDENVVDQCSEKKKCAGMFQCKNSHICVHLRDICDNHMDCVENDDEFLCTLANVSCPDFCKCLYYAVSCQGGANSTGLSIMSPYLSLHMRDTMICNPNFIQSWADTIVVIFINNSLDHFCDVVSNHSSLKTLKISHNLLYILNISCFYNISKLKSLELSNNKIRQIMPKAFHSLPNFCYLNLSGNEIYNLKNNFYFQVDSLEHISVSGNTITVVDKNVVDFIFHFVYPEIPSNLCMPLVDPTNTNILIKILMVLITLCQTIAAVMILISYSLAIWKRQHKGEIISKSARKSGQGMIVQLLILTSSNISCWIPSGVIYLTSMLLETYPTGMVIWTTIVVLPINSIINPAVFIALYIKNLQKAMGHFGAAEVANAPANTLT